VVVEFATFVAVPGDGRPMPPQRRSAYGEADMGQPAAAWCGSGRGRHSADRCRPNEGDPTARRMWVDLRQHGARQGGSTCGGVVLGEVDLRQRGSGQGGVDLRQRGSGQGGVDLRRRPARQGGDEGRRYRAGQGGLNPRRRHPAREETMLFSIFLVDRSGLK
jgi:hypothetical protein